MPAQVRANVNATMEDRLSDEEVIGQVASVPIYSLFDASFNIYNIVH